MQTQQYAVVQESSMNNGTRQIYFVGSNERLDESSQNQQQPIVLNHQIGQNNTVRVRTPLPQIPLRGTTTGTLANARQPMAQVG